MTNLSIMFSGGLDSLVAWHYAKKLGYDPQAIYVDLGHPYANKEMDAMKISSKTFGIDITYIDMKTLFPLIEKRLSNQIIPSRNLLLATIGSMFNSRVYINALDGEQNGKEHDKSDKFFKDSTELLTFLNNFFQQQTIIETPFKEMTKTEIVTWALQNNVSPQHLLATNSCYSGTKNKCGTCLTCVKRWSALYVNGINEEGYDVHPLYSQYFKELLIEIPKAKRENDFSRFSEKRIKEFNELVYIVKKLNTVSDMATKIGELWNV